MKPRQTLRHTTRVAAFALAAVSTLGPGAVWSQQVPAASAAPAPVQPAPVASPVAPSQGALVPAPQPSSWGLTNPEAAQPEASPAEGPRSRELSAADRQILAEAKAAHMAHVRVELSELGAGGTLHIAVGRSLVLHNASPMKRIYIGQPSVLQTFTSSPTEVVLTAKVPGVSSLVIWDANGDSNLYSITADVDANALRQSIHEAFPTSQINVQGSEGRIYLSGSVTTQENSDAAAKLASFYAKDVVNSLRVMPVHGRQVQLKLRIVEVDRTRAEQYGINIFKPTGKVPFALTTGQFPSTATYTPSTGTTAATVTNSDPLNLSLYSFGINVGATIRDLEQKQILQVLAEPTLTAMSGQSAKFLSGGEFPFPVVQGGTTGTGVSVSIQFRPYGVKVDFTPTVNADGSIRLKLAPEVSTLDFANAVTISGFTIPALATRRAETEVEIQSGQSFVVSGLLDHRTTESLSQLPGISNIPILGKLFATKAYTHSVVELVVLVTATVVDPLNNDGSTVEPKMIVPNMDTDEFDRQLSKEQRISAPKHP